MDKYYVTKKGFISWLRLKIRIFRMHRKFGHYKKDSLSASEYENFHVDDSDKPMIEMICRQNVVFETRESRILGMIIKTKK